jgi:hypothetical protein
MLLERAYTREEFQRINSETGWQKYEIGQTPVGLGITLVK